MKRLFFHIIVFSLFFLFSGVSESKAIHSVKPRYKRVVVVKPLRPHVHINRRIKVKVGYVWHDGYWKYSKGTRNYVWVTGRAVKQKRGKVWVSGRWVMVRGGWTYHRGFWA